MTFGRNHYCHTLTNILNESTLIMFFNQIKQKTVKRSSLLTSLLFVPLSKKVAIAFSLCLLLSCAVQTPVLFEPQHAYFQYSGRIDFQSPQAPSLSWPGSSVTTVFTGTTLSVTLDDQYGKNYFNVFIDNDFDNPVIIACKQGTHTYLIADDLTDGKHNFTLFKRTEGEEGRTKFLGLTLASGEKLMMPAAKPKRKIEFFGDSITSGMGNEAQVGQPDHLLSEKNNFLAYGAITARNLNAEYVSTSQSGIGIMVSWFDFIMPQFYDQLDAVGNNESLWDFSQWQPDVVVINLFQNDSWLIDREKRLLPVPNSTQIIQAYVDFIIKIRQVYPQAFIITALGSMDATRENSPWPGYIKAAVARYQQDTQDQNIDSLFFAFDGFGQHPRVKHHQKNAEQLTHFIKEKMHW